MKNKKNVFNVFIIILLWISIFTSWCSNITNRQAKDTNNTWELAWIANPASTYCKKNWWTLESIFDNWETYYMCHLQNWNICEEREYYNNECPTKKNNILTWNKLKKLTSWTNNTICTMDAKQCPDWSYVSRSWPNCEFAKCTTEIQDNKNIDEIIDNHKKSSWYQEEWLTEEDINLMEEIVDKLK